MNIFTHQEAGAKSFEAPDRSLKRAGATSGETRRPSSVQIRTNSGQEARKLSSRRRWAGALAIAVTRLLALTLNDISARTTLMAAGTLLTLALSADRLDEFDD